VTGGLHYRPPPCGKGREDITSARGGIEAANQASVSALKRSGDW